MQNNGILIMNTDLWWANLRKLAFTNKKILNLQNKYFSYGM